MCARGIRLLSRNPEQPIKFVWSRVVCERALNACGYIVLYTFCTGVPGRERSVGPGRKAVSKPPTLLPLLLLPLPASPLSKNPPRFAIRLWDEIFVSKLQLRSRAKFLTLLLFFSSSSLLFLFLLLLLLPHRAGPLRRFTIPNYNDYAHLLRGLTFEPPPPFARCPASGKETLEATRGGQEAEQQQQHEAEERREAAWRIREWLEIPTNPRILVSWILSASNRFEALASQGGAIRQPPSDIYSKRSPPSSILDHLSLPLSFSPSASRPAS